MENTVQKENKIQKISKSKQNKFVIGCTVDGHFKATQIIDLKLFGIKHFQIVAEFARNCKYIPPNEMLRAILDDCVVIVHMPFYFHYSLPVTGNIRKRFANLQEYWSKRQKQTFVISHCKGVKKGKTEAINKTIKNIRSYSSWFPKLTFLMENDVGGKDNKAPTIKELVYAKNVINQSVSNCGVCLDTEHAYAAGDSLFSVNYRKDISMVHLNAIPKYVEFGKHLDRHSAVGLADSKNGISFISKILGLIKPKTPIILERTFFDIIKKDIQLLRKFENAYIPNMDKKNMGKNIQKKTIVIP